MSKEVRDLLGGIGKPLGLCAEELTDIPLDVANVVEDLD